VVIVREPAIDSYGVKGLACVAESVTEIVI